MATVFPRGSSSPENSRPNSRVRRQHQHVRPDSHSRSRRPQSDERRLSSRNSPPRQLLHSPYPYQTPQIPTHRSSPLSVPMTTPNPPPLELPGGITMERTPSGNSIMSDIPNSTPSPTNHTLSSRELDLNAARRVESHFRRLPKSHSKHERILRKLIHNDPDSYLDDKALDGILTAADTVFFDGVLGGRVQWEWSSLDRYRTELIGTTALRPCSDREGFETLIVLSEPILRDPSYDRRLLLSAFLHELIHCYLFISCGFAARMEGGHTTGFHRIAELIDSWVGVGYLSLCKLKEDPMRWHKGERIGDDWRAPDPRLELVRGRPIYVYGPSHSHEGCNQSPPHQSPAWEPAPIPVGHYSNFDFDSSFVTARSVGFITMT